MARYIPAFILASLLCLGLMGCGDLLDASIMFDTGEQTITMDTSALGMVIPGGSAAIPKLPCTKDANCNAVPGLKCGGSGFSCALKCQNNSCAFVAAAEQSTPVDLSKKINSSALASGISMVTLDHVRYTVAQNSFNFDTPKLELLIGAGTAKTSNDAGVLLFSTMPTITRGTSPSGKMNVTEGGKHALQNAILNYKDPFRFFGRAGLTFKQGDKLPTGKMVLKINAFFKVKVF